jgi:hypothetical protein
MSLSLWNWGKNSLQYQEDIVEAEFKEIASKGARVSLSATEKCGEKGASQSEDSALADAVRQGGRDGGAWPV